MMFGMRMVRIAYTPLLKFSLNKRSLMAVGAAILAVLCGLLASRMATEFIPSLDEGDIDDDA
jgi:cobalt-zinc-cadmium resistance protein CzcA